MRARNLIEKDGTRPDILAVEVLLDIREILEKQNEKPKGKPRGRPRKVKS